MVKIYESNKLPRDFVEQMIVEIYLGKLGGRPLKCQQIWEQHNFGLSVSQLRRIIKKKSRC